MHYNIIEGTFMLPPHARCPPLPVRASLEFQGLSSETSSPGGGAEGRRENFKITNFPKFKIDILPRKNYY